MDHDTMRRAAAEFFGTFWLTFGGCGAAVISAGYPQLGIGFFGVAFAFGLTVPHHGLCRRSYIRRPFQSGCDAWALVCRTGAPTNTCSLISWLRLSRRSPARRSFTS